MKKKNNKGFTLIELLVAIALMLTILGIAIVNFINISDRKKEEAWESVKSEIEIAAEQYFKANEYLFEGINTTGAIESRTGKISVGTLVNQDFLNVVTDPRSGKRVSHCMLVEVKKNQNGVFTTTINNDDDNVYSGTGSGCDVYMEVETKVKDAPNVRVTYGGSQKISGSGWYTGDVTVNIKITDDNGQIAYSGKCGTTGNECDATSTSKLTLNNDNVHKITHTDDTNGYNYCAWAKSTAGGETTNCGGIFKKDATAPVITSLDNETYKGSGSISDLKNYKWTNKNFSLKVMADENGSGIDIWKYSYSKDSGYNNYNGNETYENEKRTLFTTPYSAERESNSYIKVWDKAGNESAAKVTSTISTYNSNVVNVDLKANDSRSGITNVVYTDRKVTNVSDFTWNLESLKEWNKTLSNRTLFSKLYDTEARTDTPKLVATDAAGNSSTGVSQYSGYQLCSDKRETTNYGNWSSCSASCGDGTKTRTITKVYTDNKTGTSCGSSSGGTETESCNLGSCTKDCPTITVNGTSGSNGWYKAGNISLSHNGDAGYWTWYRGTSSLNSTSTSLTSGILEGTYTYKLVGKAGEECTKSVSYDNTAPSCSISVTGTSGNNGWYRSNVNLSLTTSDASSYDLTTSQTATYTNTSSRTQTTDTKGTTYYGYVKDVAGNTNTCSKTVKKDTEPPTYILSTTTLIHKMFDDPSHNSENIFTGNFSVSRSNDTYTGTICLKNIPDGGMQVKDIGYITSDVTSGVASYTDNGYKFINKCDETVSYCSRDKSPCTQQWSITLTDDAGNSKTYTTVNLYVGYILAKTSANYVEPCYLYSYTNRYTSIELDKTSRNINTNMTSSGSCN